MGVTEAKTFLKPLRFYRVGKVGQGSTTGLAFRARTGMLKAEEKYQETWPDVQTGP